MAANAAAVWEVRTTGVASNAGGGFFVTGATGVDYSQQNTAQYALTTVTSAGAGNVILDASAAADMVGNGIHTVSGTNFTNNSWFEITSVSVGVSITCATNKAGLSISTGVGATGVMNIGGAAKLGTLDDAMFEEGVGTNGSGGHIYHIKSGTYTLGGAVTIAAAGGTQAPIQIIGYNATRNDTPTTANMPVIACGANPFNIGVNWNVSYISFTGTGNPVLTINANDVVNYCKVVNSSTTANQIAIQPASSGQIDTQILGCEAVSYRGVAISGGSALNVLYCYIHDSDIGIKGIGNQFNIFGNIIESCVTAAIKVTTATTGACYINNNTLFGGDTNKTGNGIDFVTGCTDMRVYNNIIYGFVTGVKHADTQTVGMDDYNCYNNNTNDVSAAGQWQKGSHDSVLAPTFTAATQVTGSTATLNTTGGNHIVDANATFVTSGITAGVDFIHVTGGTTASTYGKYGITSVDSETQLTVDVVPTVSAVADHTWQITKGHNFAIGVALRTLGFPGAFPGGLTTGFTDIGATQRSESASAARATIASGNRIY